jgi:hypothetical protein
VSNGLNSIGHGVDLKNMGGISWNAVNISIRSHFTSAIQRLSLNRIVQWGPEDMIADFFTKPLQGSAFKKMLKLIMNMSDDLLFAPSPQGCVENTQAPDDGQTETKKIEVEDPPPINYDSDDPEWKVVVAKGRRSYANVMKREEATKVTFSRK